MTICSGRSFCFCIFIGGMIRITLLRNIALLTHALLTLFQGARGANGWLSQAALARCLPLGSSPKGREQRLSRFLDNPRLTPEIPDSSPDRFGFRNSGHRIGAPDFGSDHDSRDSNLTDRCPLSGAGFARGFFLFYPCGDSQEPEHFRARPDFDRDELFSRGEPAFANHGSGLCPGGPPGKAAAGGDSFFGSSQSQSHCVFPRETVSSGKVYG